MQFHMKSALALAAVSMLFRSSAPIRSRVGSILQYRGHWFWIDDRDLGSKRMFRFLLMFASMAESGASPQGPLLTIPAR